MSNSRTAVGIYHGDLNFSQSAGADSLIDAAHMLPYPLPESQTGKAQLPTSINVTEYHFVLLYGDRVAAVGALNERPAWEEKVPLVSNVTTRMLLMVIRGRKRSCAV